VAGDFDAVLRVTDSQGRTSTGTVSITVSAGLTATLSKDVFNPTTGETVSINTTLTAPTVFTLKVRDRNGNPVRTLVQNANRNPGYYSDVWNGKNDAGQTVGSGVYLYIIEYQVGGKAYVYDVTNNVSLSRFTPSTTYPPQFNPFSAESNFFRYSMDKKAEVTVYIAPFSGGAGNRVKTLQLRKPQKAGSYVMVWDGTDDAGNLVPAGTYVIAPQGWELPANAIIVQTEPVISDMTVTPSYYCPDIGPYDTDEGRLRMSYTLSEQAAVTARIYNDKNYIVQTITQANVPAGSGNTLYWDGKNSEGAYAGPGIYRVKLVATDQEGSRSEDANGLVVIFY
jgi:flagellar hook assembly protein FlgD